MPAVSSPYTSKEGTESFSTPIHPRAAQIVEATICIMAPFISATNFSNMFYVSGDVLPGPSSISVFRSSSIRSTSPELETSRDIIYDKTY